MNMFFSVVLLSLCLLQWAWSMTRSANLQFTDIARLRCGDCTISREGSDLFGCSNSRTQNCVCGEISSCCSREWGDECAEYAIRNCGCPSYGLDYRWSIHDLVPRDEYLAAGVHEAGYFNWMNGIRFPGVAIFDYDNDGDEDIFVTSYTGTPNYLFQNLLHEEGELKFRNVGVEAGLGAIEHDSSGVCYGDMDNDGDFDLFICTGREDHNMLFRNEGDGTFREFTEESGFDTGMGYTSTSCAFGDVNRDGFHDIFVGRADNASLPCYNRVPNQLLIGNGHGKFVDESVERGFLFESMTWAVGLADYDLDGDLDAFCSDDGCFAHDQGPVGFIRIWENDGNGYFDDVTAEKSSPEEGGYMGLTLADFNGDGTIDVFATDVGHWAGNAWYFNYTCCESWPPRNSRLMINDNRGHLVDTYTFNNEVKHTPFGWGTTFFDVDNNANTDILFHGGFVSDSKWHLSDNPGVVLLNDGHGNYFYDPECSSSTDHSIRKVHGVAVGDLDQDGFVDMVSASMLDYTYKITMMEAFGPNVNPDSVLPYSTPFDDIVGYTPNLIQVDKTARQWVWHDTDRIMGTLSVEMSSGNNGNNWIKVRTLGSYGITRKGMNPIDGIGAVVRVHVEGTTPQTVPILGGDSQCAQSELQKIFGLGKETQATVDVMWPGVDGPIWNRLYDVPDRWRGGFPEIPCTFKFDAWESRRDLSDCLEDALDDLTKADLIRPSDYEWFKESMLYAYHEEEELSELGGECTFAGIGKLKGREFDNFYVTEDSIAECCLHCRRTSDCGAWSYNPTTKECARYTSTGCDYEEDVQWRHGFTTASNCDDCEGVDQGCCTPETPCVEGNGDCDHNDECVGDLVCRPGGCPRVPEDAPVDDADKWDLEDDCCQKAGPLCVGEKHCCNDRRPCDVDEGDCDIDSHCLEGLECGSSNCPLPRNAPDDDNFGWDKGDDCCRLPLSDECCRRGDIPNDCRYSLEDGTSYICCANGEFKCLYSDGSSRCSDHGGDCNDKTLSAMVEQETATASSDSSASDYILFTSVGVVAFVFMVIVIILVVCRKKLTCCRRCADCRTAKTRETRIAKWLEMHEQPQIIEKNSLEAVDQKEAPTSEELSAQVS